MSIICLSGIKQIFEQNKNIVVSDIYNLVNDMQNCIIQLEYDNFFDNLTSHS